MVDLTSSKTINLVKGIFLGIKQALLFIILSTFRSFRSIIVYLLNFMNSANWNVVYTKRISTSSKTVPISSSAPLSRLNNGFLKNFLTTVEYTQTRCITLISNNLMKLFLIVVISIFILSLITGKLETRTRGYYRTFIRKLPVKLSVLLIFLKVCKIFTSLILYYPVIPSRNMIISECKLFLIIAFIFVCSFIMFKIKSENLLDFYSICSYSLALHIIVVVHGILS